MQPVPVRLPLTGPPLVLNGRLVVRDDGDDVFFKEGTQAEGHGVDLDTKGEKSGRGCHPADSGGATAASPGISCWACTLSSC